MATTRWNTGAVLLLAYSTCLVAAQSEMGPDTDSGSGSGETNTNLDV